MYSVVLLIVSRGLGASCISFVVLITIYTTVVLRRNLCECLIHFKTLPLLPYFPDVAIQRSVSVKRDAGKRSHETLWVAAGDALSLYNVISIKFDTLRGNVCGRGKVVLGAAQ